MNSSAPDVQTIRFVLNGQLQQARGVHPCTTVLDHLRDMLRCTGTKEGCAEGDCGACVVLLGELDAAGQAIQWKPVNSCMQVLPVLNGRAVKTVEGLASADGSLHPVQRAFVECHASQCGFCTPGFVMAAAVLAARCGEQPPTRAQIQDALSGNLCRCTGYRPIVEATAQACAAPWAERALQDPAELALLRQVAPQPLQDLAGFVAPTSLPALLDHLERHPDAQLLAGSTEFGLAVNKRFARPERMAYVGHVPELRRVQATPGAWHLGAALPLDEVSPMIAAEWPDFAEVLRRFGSPPIRATATLGGNLANGSPIGDTLPCLMALGAVLHLRSARSARTLPLEQFYTGYKTHALQAGELIEAVELPRRPASQGWRFRAHKVSKREDQDISAVCVALGWRNDAGVMRDVRLAFNGLAPFVSRAVVLEALLEGRRAAELSAAAVDAALAASFTPLSDVRASARYRLLVARNLLLSFVRPDADDREAST